MSQNIKSKECRFAVYCKPKERGLPDLHMVKEVITLEDGTQKNNILLVRDFKRPFYVTKKGYQNHKCKKEWTNIEELNSFKSTQTELQWSVAKALETPWFKGDMRKLCNSPYVYGSDILSTAIIKKLYMNKYPEAQSKFSVAVLDTETDVINGTGEIIMATITFKEIVYSVVLESFLDGVSDVQNRVIREMDNELGEYVKKRNLKCELVIVKSEIDIIKLVIAKAHELQPDFLAIWNMDFDIPKIMAACERAGVDIADIFSDPSIPKEYRFFTYKPGPKKKVTASGLVTPIKPAARWHTVFTPASFYLIDAMCVFKHVRVGKPEEQSYSLDSILNKMLGVRKLKLEEVQKYKKIKYHQVMQRSYKINYIIYNRFDCISIEILDELTNDLSVSLPSFAGCSDFTNFKSQPRRAADNLHFYVLDKGKVIASTGSTMAEEVDSKTLSLEDWIITLPAHLVVDNGLKMCEDAPNLRGNARVHQGDLDVAGAYPTNECVMNVSKETTKREICRVSGVSEYTQRMQGINLSGGSSNAVEFCTTMFKFPELTKLLENFTKSEMV